MSFKSKNGKKFDAYLTLDLEGKITFEFPKRNRGKS
ncbi:topoisomerase C-terminal repeat-containing protein [Virgibacillus dokdonensis]